MFEYLKFWFMKKLSELIFISSFYGIIILLFIIWVIFIIIKDIISSKIKRKEDDKNE